MKMKRAWRLHLNYNPVFCTRFLCQVGASSMLAHAEPALLCCSVGARRIGSQECHRLIVDLLQFILTALAFSLSIQAYEEMEIVE